MVTKYYICPFEQWGSNHKLFLPHDVSEEFFWDYAGTLVALSDPTTKSAGVHPLSLLDRAKAKGEKEGYSNMICVVTPEVYFRMRNFFQNFASWITFNSKVDIEVVFLEYNEDCVSYKIVTIEAKNEAYILREEGRIAA